MSDCCTISMTEDSYATVLDAVQRAAIDKSASKATRKAAFLGAIGLGRGGSGSRRDIGQFDCEGYERSWARRLSKRRPTG
jgi:hypothetical protein